MLVFLHGSGERGTDLNLVRRHGPPKEVAKGRKFPFIIISPQCPDGQWWDVDALGGMIKKVERDYKIDRRREYLTGISMGGYGAWAWAIAEPRRFAAVAPICGGGDDSLVDKIRTVPVWAFHGDADQSVPIAEDQKMVDALQDAGGNVKFTVVKGGQHDIWSDMKSSIGCYRTGAKFDPAPLFIEFGKYRLKVFEVLRKLNDLWVRCREFSAQLVCGLQVLSPFFDLSLLELYLCDVV